MPPVLDFEGIHLKYQIEIPVADELASPAACCIVHRHLSNPDQRRLGGMLRHLFRWLNLNSCG